MIPRDWTNMTQAVWRSPLLPLQPSTGNPSQKESHRIGTGKRFKVDLMRYIDAYGWRLSELKTQLQNYDFSAICAAFIGSTPSREKPSAAKPDLETSWGWPGVQQILSTVPIISAATSADEEEAAPDIIIQISSIATLGANSTWLDNFQHALWKRSSERDTDALAYLYDPTLNIIWPTVEEIRTSLDGYSSGGSIHMKTQSKAQEKQLEYLRPYFCHWKHMDDSTMPFGHTTTNATRRALRGPAAPHIKTYIRFHDQSQRRIDWAMVTSANLSKQAWGDVENKDGKVWIQSWECGVVVWPELFSPSFSGKTSEGKERQEEHEVQMVPVFGKDLPSEDDVEKKVGDVSEEKVKKKIVVGLRMPYDLPLEPYAEDDVPWTPHMAYDEPDWMGTVWTGY
jgi:tyrosyl-DNA phosphodiesterase-1